MRVPRPRCKYVRSVGLEIECGIPTQEGVRWVNRLAALDDRFVYGSDGSVHLPGCYDSDAELRYWVYIEEWSRLVNILRFLWQEIGIQQNSTCGNHVHLRLREDWTQILIHPRFVRYFQRCYLHFAMKQNNPQKYLARTVGNFSAFYRWRRYCDLEQQVIDSYHTRGSRYRSINYWSLSESQRTIEFRIMPHAENFEEHLRMILFIIRTVERYCRKFSKGKLELSCSEVSPLQDFSFGDLYGRISATAVHFYTIDGYQLGPLEVEVEEPQPLEDIAIEVTTL